MVWSVSIEEQNGHAYVKVMYSDYSGDFAMTPFAARALASQLYRVANDADVKNRPPVKRFWD